MRELDYSEALIDVLKWMLTFEEDDRPTFE